MIEINTHERIRRVQSSSMSRIYSQFNGGGSFGVITAFTTGSVSENLPYMINIGKDINNFGVKSGFVPIKGFWFDTDERKSSHEPSLWIPNITREDIKGLAIKYNQKEYIWGSNGVWGMYRTGEDEPYQTGTKFSVLVDEELDKAWSEYRGDKFKLV